MCAGRYCRSRLSKSQDCPSDYNQQDLAIQVYLYCDRFRQKIRSSERLCSNKVRESLWYIHPVVADNEMVTRRTVNHNRKTYKTRSQEDWSVRKLFYVFNWTYLLVIYLTMPLIAQNEQRPVIWSVHNGLEGIWKEASLHSPRYHPSTRLQRTRNIASFFFEWETFQTKVVEKIKTHILRSILFF